MDEKQKSGKRKQVRDHGRQQIEFTRMRFDPKAKPVRKKGEHKDKGGRDIDRGLQSLQSAENRHAHPSETGILDQRPHIDDPYEVKQDNEKLEPAVDHITEDDQP